MSKRQISFFSLVLFSLIFISAPKVLAAWVVRPEGVVGWQPKGQVLASMVEAKGDDRVESNSAGSGGSSNSGPGSTRGDDSDNEDGEENTPIPVVRTEVRSGGEVRTETRFPDGSRLRTRVEPGRSRVEVVEGGTKVRIERKDDRFRLKVENEAGQDFAEIEPEGGELLKIEERRDKDVIRIATGSAGRLIVSRNQFSATTSFPLSVDLTTNQLTVTTPAGSRVVAILPDQAVKNMLAANAVDQVGGLPFAEIVRQASPSPTLSQAVDLTVNRLGEPVYQITGLKTHRFLGFIPVALPRTLIVSAQTGGVEAVQQSLLTRLVDLLSL